MGLFLLLILTTLIYFVDKAKYKTVFTPSIVLALPFTLVAILYKLFSSKLGFYELNSDVLYIWIFGLFFFWIPGLVSSSGIKIQQNTFKNNVDFKLKIKKFNGIMLNFTFFLSVILTYYFYNAFLLYKSSGGDAVELFLGTGIQAHLVILFKYISVFSFLGLFVQSDRFTKLKQIYIILIAIGLSVLYATKSGILLLLISYYFAYSVFFKKTLKIYHIVVAVLTAFGVFLLSYSLVFGYLAPFDFIFNHTLLYFVSGIASMNAYFQGLYLSGIEPEILIRPFFNIFYTITGQKELIEGVVSDIWTDIGGTTINVKTFFGTIYLYGGLYLSIFYLILISLLIHNFFILVLKKSNFFALAMYVQILGVLSFGWFDYYFNTVNFFETIFFTFVFNFVFIKKI